MPPSSLLPREDEAGTPVVPCPPVLVPPMNPPQAADAKAAPTSRPAFVVYSPPYDERWGGIMVLHAFTSALRRAGVDAYLWYGDAPVRVRGIPRWIARRARDRLLALTGRRHAHLRNPDVAPHATWWRPKDPIVVYSETVAGNPLKARRVVRWFLNKPGRLSGTIEFGPGELYFYYQPAFNDPAINPDPESRLSVVSILGDVYQHRNTGERHGTCYILRKGRSRAPDPATLDGEVIDRLSHREIADLFNRREYCVSYDTYTMYSFYAAMCGCKSVVVPEPGVPREQWLATSHPAYGVAYGFDDLPRAEATAPLIRDFLLETEKANDAAVQFFLERCERFFNLGPR